MCHIASAMNLAQMPPDAAGELKKKLEPVAQSPTTEPPVPQFASQPPAQPAPTANPQPETATPQPTSYVSEPAPEPIKKPEPAQEKPKVALSLNGMPASASLIPNLKELSGAPKKEEEQKPEYLSGEAREYFSEIELIRLWNDYAAKMKQATKLNLFTLMTGSAPKLLDDFKIEVQVENKIQENTLMLEKIDLLNFLRTELRNFAIDIVTRQAEQSTKKKLYTSSEKYQHMVEKNPKLEEFRKKFNLGID